MAETNTPERWRERAVALHRAGEMARSGRFAEPSQLIDALVALGCVDARAHLETDTVLNELRRICAAAAAARG